MLRAMWRVLETELRKLLTGHEGGNAGHSQELPTDLRASARPYQVAEVDLRRPALTEQRESRPAVLFR